MTLDSITKAAVRTKSGIVVSLPRPARHHAVMAAARSVGIDTKRMHNSNQGFITKKGFYVTRKQAEVIARRCQQLKGGYMLGSVLTSEDLW